MCGIFGILTTKSNKENIYDKIIDGLFQLQNRGYDSSGLSVLNKDKIETYKYASTATESSLDKLKNLNLTYCESDEIYQGIGHNRWATHGIKNDANAHPHLSNDNNFAIVHNGIIENYAILKQFLVENGYIFYSQTDTEVIVNLISYYYNISNDTFNALQSVIDKLEGTYGIILLDVFNPDKIYCVRNGSPLLIGKNEDCVIITSEQSGFCNLISNYITLNTDDICVIKRAEDKSNELIIKTFHNYMHKNVNIVERDLTPYPYEHWTLKEINYQSTCVLNAINNGGRIKNQCEVKLGGLEQHINILKDIDNIIILGCGTSFYSGLYGMYYLKKMCNFNSVQTFDGAEFNENDICKIGKTALILISQSGETKDLHRCIDISKQNNLVTIGIINVVDSLIAREVDCGIYCNAGVEVGVASTKSFTSQVVCLSLISIWFAQIHNINENKRVKMISDLHNLSYDFKNTIDDVLEQVKIVAHNLKKSDVKNMFLLGKGSDEYVAREGSLKIKEISYVHAEGYSASSLKHGPFALLDENVPVIILNLETIYTSKIINCLQEVSSRNSPIILITNQGSKSNSLTNSLQNVVTINVRENTSYSSLLGAIPLQLIAYYLSIEKGINPDKPKNLAKVVTVE
jgi:glucosamine--fructose-6-phosphate aminotransferase (isomerizing)